MSAAPIRQRTGAPAAATAPRPPLPDRGVDAAFAWDDASGLLPVAPCDDDDAGAWLAGRIVRDPLDMAAHARRVVLACRRGRGDDAFGALADLFLATGPRARALREALLDHAAPCLDAGAAAFLRDALADGLGPDADLPLGTHARLDRGLVGRADLVACVDTAATARTAVEAAPAHARAAALIDQGDVDAARALLEEALIADPTDLACARELQAIYRHARDEAGRAAMGRRLAEQLGHLPQAWA